MEPNLTIFVQMCNFFIGFLLIKYLLLKPAVTYLKSEELKKDDLSKDISDQEKLLEAKTEKKKSKWATCQTYFRESCPRPVEKKVFALKYARKEPERTEISHKEIEQLSQEVEKALVERIEHVRE